jgi:hypothetical protein
LDINNSLGTTLGCSAAYTTGGSFLQSKKGFFPNKTEKCNINPNSVMDGCQTIWKSKDFPIDSTDTISPNPRKTPNQLGNFKKL